MVFVILIIIIKVIYQNLDYNLDFNIDFDYYIYFNSTYFNLEDIMNFSNFAMFNFNCLYFKYSIIVIIENDYFLY